MSIYAQNPNPNSGIDAFIQDEMEIEHLPGLSSIIVKDGEIIWLESYGFADIENSTNVEDTTVFLLASLSKLFTGTASMQAFEQGLIDLDTDISTYLTWSLNVPGFENESITIRQLMTHSASIEDSDAMDLYYDYPDPSISLQDCIQGYFSISGGQYDPTDNFYNSAPGTEYNYSNMGTALNGYITESASGIPFDDFCDENLFNPLCMEKTAWHFADFDSSHVARPYRYQGGNYEAIPHYGFADYPNGQLRSNVMDIGNFMIAYLNGGSLGSHEILSSESVDEMLSSQIPALEPTQGLNWYQEELYYDGGTAMLWGHNGGESGASTDMYLDPDNNIGICILSNGEGDGIYICDELYNFALTLNPVASIIPDCISSNSVEALHSEKKEIVKVIDLLGRETEMQSNIPLIIIYSDGSAKRIMKTDH